MNRAMAMCSIRTGKSAAVLAAALLLAGGTAGYAQNRSESREATRSGGPGKPAVEQVLSPPAPATKDPPLKVFLSDDGQTLYLVGMILDDSFHQVDAVLRKAPKVRRVHLSSAGGYTIEARLIATLVRKRKLDTYVEFYCASACTQIFAAGRERVLGPHAQLGFHQAVVVDSSGKTVGVRQATDRKLNSLLVFGINGNDTLRLAYEMAGFSPAFIEKALSYENSTMWLPTSSELLEARVITRQAQASELPPPPGAGQPRDKLRAQLLQQPLWRAAQARLPAVADKAMDEVWRIANSGYSLDAAILTGRNQLIDAATDELARAPDAYLDLALKLYADAARSERALGYPACKSLDGDPGFDKQADTRFMTREDEFYTGFLMSEERVPAMDEDEAVRYFAREVLPKVSHLYRDGFSSGRSGKCKLGFQTFEVIDGFPKKTRLKSYRALLSMTASLDD